MRRHLTTLDISEKQNLAEIRDLKSKIALLDRQKEAQAASEQAGELDEETLDMVYHALNFADPMTPEDLRLETRRKQKSLESAVGDKHYLNTWQGRRILQRLVTLDRRLKDFHPAANITIEAKSEQKDPYRDVAALLKGRSDASDSKREEKDLSYPSNSREGGRGKEMLGEGSSLDAAIFLNATAREDLLSRLEELSCPSQDKTAHEVKDGEAIPLGIATKQEWEALIVAFAYARDEDKVGKLLETAELSGHKSLLKDLMNAALDIYAEDGNIRRCQTLFSLMTTKGIFPDDYTRHCLVKAQVVATRLEGALDLLKDMEDSIPASMQTYTLVIEHLIKHSSSFKLQAKAWTLFYRMRLVAHPIPDAPLYALMIQACALGIPQPNANLWKPKDPLSYGGNNKQQQRLLDLSRAAKPDTERALDLFREMTTRYSIRPTVDVYTRVIAACVKRKDTYEKGFEIFRSMVEMERHRLSGQDEETVSSSSSFAPSRATYDALLQGCARSGDLLRARWILAEMLRTATSKWKELKSREERGAALEDWEIREVETMRPNERTLTNVFYAYASFTPPADQRRPLVSATEKSGSVGTQRKEEDADSDDGAELLVAEQTESLQEGRATDFIDEDTLTYRLPTTSKAIFREATALMERIKEDFDQQGGLLSSVRPDPQLMHSYIAVISQHCPEYQRVAQLKKVMLVSGEESEAKSLFEYFGLRINGYTCEAVLDACSKMTSHPKLIDLAENVWDQWIAMGGSSDLFAKDETRANELGFSSRIVAKCWASMIRVYAKANELDTAMGLLRQFAQLYPPAGVQTIPAAGVDLPPPQSPPSPLQSSQQVDRAPPILFSKPSLPSKTTMGNCSLKQAEHSSDEHEIQSPILLFQPIQLLHLRLVEAEDRRKDLDYLTFLIRMYTKSRIPKMPQSLRGADMISKQSAMSKIVQQRSSSSSSSSYPSSFSPRRHHLKRSYG
ncbi:hypothetical protein CBS101457_001819 [Exobasidium rhododendri]|nr:hypothetical protein CBS101457_001819 [Exobasidium rhododendri]